MYDEARWPGLRKATVTVTGETDARVHILRSYP